MPLDDRTLRDQLSHTVERTNFPPSVGTRYEGKVRDTYAQGDRLVLVTTDRISAFDHVLHETIPFKGQVLNQLAAYFFEATADVMPNHVEAIPDPNVTVARRCEPVALEFVVRGYLEGHAWRVYASGGRELCGRPLPDGLKQGSPLPEPILTPATKAEEGHDEDITQAEAVRRGLISEKGFGALKEAALALFERGRKMAREQDLLLVDTKYEFGRVLSDDSFRLIDEVHTPDSSRYYHADGYEDRLRAGESQPQLSKEFVREWLMDQGFRGKESQKMPSLTDDFRVEVGQRYINLYEKVTDRSFVPDSHENPEERMLSKIKDL